MEKKVVVEYKTKRDYCSCCGQKLPETKVSEVKKFYLTKENFLDWSDEWDEIVKYDDLQDVINDFVYETIDFFATNSHESVRIDKRELEKVMQFVLTEVANQ